MSKTGKRQNEPSETTQSPWAELLSSNRLKAAGLAIDPLAQRVGVSAAYLRLLRQGKRSASTETAGRLLTELGLEVQTKPNDNGADLVADDGEGNVVVVSTKPAKAGRPSSLERTLEQLLRTTEELRETVDAQVYLSTPEGNSPALAAFLGRLERQLESDPSHDAGDIDAPSLEEGATDEGSSERAPLLHKDLSRSGARFPALPMFAMMSAFKPDAATRNRGQAQRLLESVSDEDLPLAAAYLSLLVDRAERR